MKKRSRRGMLWAAVGAVLAGVAIWGLWPRPTAVEVGVVSSGPLLVTLDEEGETRVCERYVVSAPVAGKILRIELEPGDPVTRDETILASLLPQASTLLDARSRDEATAAVGAAEAHLAQIGAEREVAAAELAFAETELGRIDRLATEEVVSQEQLDSAKLDVGCRGDQLLAAEFAVEAAEHQLEMARARLASGETEAQAEPILLRSPVDGVVLRRLRESETVVRAGEELMEVGDSADLEIVADFLSSDAVRIRPGARVLIDSWGGETALEGQVKLVEPGAFTKVSALGVEEQRVNVIVEFTGSAAERSGLADAFRLDVRVVVWESDHALQVPVGALFRHGGDWAVFAVVDGRARLRPIDVGHLGEAAAEVVGGLNEGDTVILHPGQSIEDGLRVRSSANA